jgi:catechol 2,3-dioxygenase-like lactoylglutathione lyase family enzyme
VTPTPRVTGIGGVFFKTRDRARLGDWHGAISGSTCRTAASRSSAGVITRIPRAKARRSVDDQLLRRVRSKHAKQMRAAWLPEYRVADLEAVLAALRGEGVSVGERVEETAGGRFGWITDPDGNRIELWQPPPGR